MIDKLITRLQKVKRTGQDRYIACCPAHDDKSPSLTIAEKDGKVIFHCFAGCSPADVLAAVGLTFADLYPERLSNDYLYGGLQNKKVYFNPNDVLKCVEREIAIIGLAAEQLAQNIPLDEDEQNELNQASERIYEAVKLLGIKL